MAYQYGRRPAKNAPALRLSRFLSTAVPAYPRYEDYLKKLPGWEMLGNDIAGDCNAVAWANMRRLVTGTLTHEYYPTQDQVWEFYRTQNPGFDPQGTASTDGPGSSHDQGMEIQTGLEYLHASGGPDGVRAVAFAKVDHTSLPEVKAALSIFGGLWLGILVQEANQAQFSRHQNWTDVPGSPVEGGHAILGGGYYTEGVRFITWGRESTFSLSFWDGTAEGSALVEEAWAVIWPEQLGNEQFEAGIDQAALAADYQALTGSPLNLGG